MNEPTPNVTTRGRIPALRAAGWSHPGRVRSHNEDRYYCDPGRGLFVVIDGVGGHAGGELAAGTALEVVRDRLGRRTGTPEERLREAIALANNEIHRLSREDEAFHGMSCVLTAALVEEGAVTVGHVGDTRLYKIRGGRIDKLTHDHSVVGVREDAGELSEAEAMAHPRRNEIYRDVGSGRRDPYDDDFIEIVRAPFEEDAALLLCSDGLTDLVPSRQVLHVVLRTAGTPERAVDELIHQANEAGGKDNVTVVVVEGERFGRPEWSKAHDLAGGAAGEEPVPSGRAAREDQSRPGWTRLKHLVSGRGALFFYGLLTGLALLTLFQDFLGDRLTPAGGRTLDVAAAGDAYASIGEALAAARPGDVVEVAPGVYAESIRLPDGVRLRSRMPREAVIRPAAPGDTAVVVERGALLSGFQIVGVQEGEAPGLVLRGGTAEDVEVTGAGGFGVVVAPETTGILRVSLVRANAGGGVDVGAGARPRLVQNVIVDNGPPGASRPGLRLAASAAPLLEGNVLGGRAAVDVVGGDTTVLRQQVRYQLDTHAEAPAEAGAPPGGS